MSRAAFNAIAAHPDAPQDLGPWVVGMHLEHVIFASWTVPEPVLRAAVPAWLELDPFADDYYVTVVALHMQDLHLPKVPAMPGFRDFDELNLRTYVRYHGDAGVFFLSVDTSGEFYAWIAKHALHLPCHRAEMTLDGQGSRYRMDSQRVSRPVGFEARYTAAPGGAPATRESLERFLCERYFFYGPSRGGEALMRGDFRHAPWVIAPAEIQFTRNDLFAAAGLPTAVGEPASVFYAESNDAVSWLPRRVG